ncbi:MAG TPA: NYN domain-containing protein [Chthoniobacterales bacterium]|nr:NYN domain-containing protein [Chthoniobacterales bacterium]
MALKTNVYIDGFNLYYGCVRDTPHKWLDLAALCARLLPNNQINRIRYFTALVTPRAGDPQQRNRQEMYLRAIRTIPNLTIDLGRFLASKVWMMRSDYSGKVEVLKSEEKGSDVNLASRLLIDCYRSNCDIAVIVSNDSDLVFPIEHVKRHLGKTVGIVNPRQRPSRELLAVANFFKSIRPSVLASCQFPVKLTDALGDFHKPPTW